MNVWPQNTPPPTITLRPYFLWPPGVNPPLLSSKLLFTPLVLSLLLDPVSFRHAFLSEFLCISNRCIVTSQFWHPCREQCLKMQTSWNLLALIYFTKQILILLYLYAKHLLCLKLLHFPNYSPGLNIQVYMKKETVAIDVGTKDKSEVHTARLILAIKVLLNRKQLRRCWKRSRTLDNSGQVGSEFFIKRAD